MFSKTKDLFNNNNSNVSIHMKVLNGDIQSEKYKEKNNMSIIWKRKTSGCLIQYINVKWKTSNINFLVIWFPLTFKKQYNIFRQRNMSLESDELVLKCYTKYMAADAEHFL